MAQSPTAYSVMMVREAELRDGTDLLKGLNITLQDIESKEYFDDSMSRKILKRFTQWNREPDWGFHFGRRLGIASHGPLGFGAISAPTVADGLTMLSHFIQTRTVYSSATIARPGDSLHVCFTFAPDAQEFVQRLSETLAMIFQSYLESVGASVAPTVWRFPFPAPAHQGAYARWLGGGYSFDASNLTLEVPGSVGMLASPFNNPAVYQSCVAQCQALLSWRDSPLVTNIRRALQQAYTLRAAEALPTTPIPDLDAMADSVGMSRRTLMRKLRAAETSFQGIKDSLLKDQIRELLCGDRQLQEIAEVLDYQDAANFNRACHRLFGQSPSTLRESLVTVIS